MTLLRGADKYLKIWVALVLMCVVVIAGLTISNIRTNTALQNSRAANMQSHHAIDCINNTLAARASTTAKDNAAHVQFQNAFTADSVAFGVLLTDILTAAPESKSTPDFLAYIKVHDRLIAVSQSASKTLQSDQDYRDAHPLGAC